MTLTVDNSEAGKAFAVAPNFQSEGKNLMAHRSLFNLPTIKLPFSATQFKNLALERQELIKQRRMN